MQRPPRFLQVTPSFELTSLLLTEDVVVDLVVQIWAATEERLAHMTRTRLVILKSYKQPQNKLYRYRDR